MPGEDRKMGSAPLFGVVFPGKSALVPVETFQQVVNVMLITAFLLIIRVANFNFVWCIPHFSTVIVNE